MAESTPRGKGKEDAADKEGSVRVAKTKRGDDLKKKKTKDREEEETEEETGTINRISLDEFRAMARSELKLELKDIQIPETKEEKRLNAGGRVHAANMRATGNRYNNASNINNYNRHSNHRNVVNSNARGIDKSEVRFDKVQSAPCYLNNLL